MKLGVYVVKDVPAQQYGQPMLCRTEMVASRTFISMLAQGKLSAADFELYSIGVYDDETGIIIPTMPEKVTPIYRKDAGLEEVI